MEPVEPVQPVTPRDPRYVRPVQPVEPVQPVQPVQRVQPVEPVEPVEPVQPMRRADPDDAYAPTWRGWRAAQIVYTIFGVLEALILIRVILKLLAANPDAGFSNLIYGITGPFVAPFQGVFPTPQSNNSVLDVAALLAILVYALLAWGIARLIDLASQRRGPTYTA